MNRKLFFYFVLVAVLGVGYLYADIRQVRSFSNGNLVATRVGKSQVYTQTSTWIVDQCSCSILDTTTLFHIDLAPYQNFTMATYLLTSNNQSDKDSLLGSGKDTMYIRYEISQQNLSNDSGWISLEPFTSYDTLLALTAGLPTLYPLITTTAYTPPMGNHLRGRAFVKKFRTASVPDTIETTWKFIFTPIDR